MPSKKWTKKGAAPIGGCPQGLIHVYTGNGKGKTTASLGLALRALGRGYRVYIIQFMKGRNFGELISFKKFKNLTIEQFGSGKFINKANLKESDIKLAQGGLAKARKIMKEGKYKLFILDEINCAIEWKLIKINDIIDLIKNKPQKLELVLTGRYAHPKVKALADYLTIMKEGKHPYKKGVQARKGIEF